MKKIRIIISLLSERGRMFKNSYTSHRKIKFHASVTAFSSYNIQAEGLKIGPEIHDINAVKM